MKGDGNIKIKIKFIGVGYKNLYQAYVEIFDKEKNKIFEGYTYNGYLNLCLNKNDVYILKSVFNGQTICTPLMVSNNTNYVISFIQNNNLNNRTVTFFLTDYYYNLPIEKGEILLWQR